MLDHSHLPLSAIEEVFGPNSLAANVGWVSWRKPRGAAMIGFLCHGGGGGGGNGAVGAASTAAGGGGGGSSGFSFAMIPAWAVPAVVYISVGYGGLANTAGILSRISATPDATLNNSLLFANPGNAGGNASGGTAGTGGTAGAIATIASCPLGNYGMTQFIAGQAGVIGGTTVAGANLTLPVTGNPFTGGSGGGGLPAAATVGTAGGSFTVAGMFPPHAGGVGGSGAITPPDDGSNGWAGVITSLLSSYGGTGGGSSHGSATGAGLVGGRGGAGGPGSGGGGGGGALTGSTQGTGGKGGDGRVIVLVW